MVKSKPKKPDVAFKKGVVNNPSGRPTGIISAATYDQIAKKIDRIMGVMLNGAVGGNVECARLCLEYAGALPNTNMQHLIKTLIEEKLNGRAEESENDNPSTSGTDV